ncbi:MAG: T9SS type A sorting domain-containing protein [Chitinophagales bacterium]
MLHRVKYLWLLLLFICGNLLAQNGWINTYTNALYGETVREHATGGYSIAGFKGIVTKHVLWLEVDEEGVEINRIILGDFNQDYTFKEDNVELLLTQDGGLLVSAYSIDDASEKFVNLLKYNDEGELEWRKDYVATTDFKITAIAEFSGGYLIGATDRVNLQTTYLTMTDLLGEVIWQKTLSDSVVVNDIELDTAGNIVVLGSKPVQIAPEQLTEAYFLGHFNMSGNVLSANLIPLDYNEFKVEVADIYIAPDNSITAVGSYLRWDDPNQTVNLLLFSLNYNGSIDDINGYQINSAQISEGKSVVKTDDNGWVVCGRLNDNGDPNAHSGFYAKIAANGLLEWVSNDDAYNYGVQLSQIIATLDGGFLSIGQNSNNFGGVKAIKINSNGLIQTSTISGVVFKDQNENCLFDDSELILKNAVVELTNLATGEVNTQWSSNFGFDFRVDTGEYLINIVYLDEVWEYRCIPTIIHIDEEYSDVFVNVPLFPKFDCPLMTVDLTTPIVERCEETSYKIQVINNGTAVAENAYLDVELDPTIELLASSRPFTVVENGWYRFQLGDVNFSAARVVDLQVRINCDSTILGQTHCASAYVYPDSLCIDLNPEWDGSVIDVDGDCLGDSLGFEISNHGAGRMRAPLIYYVIEDDAIFRSGTFQLDPGESIVFFIPSTGATYRVETEENPGFIFGGRPSATVEGCGALSLEDASLGFVNRFPLYDNSPFVSIDCQENIIDLEGNLHVAYPKGYDEMHYIRVGDELEYFIRFENTDEEVINRVEIIDTLDEAVDITTLSIGVTSHPYNIVIEEERILKIIFNEIELTTADEGNHFGFVKFKVNLKQGTAIGTLIENKVTIVLADSIIETEVVYHTLGEDIVLSVEHQYRPTISINSYPNPFKEQFRIVLEGETIQLWTLNIYAQDGRLVRKEEFYGNEVILQRKDLLTGIYFFTIADINGLMGSGKLIVQ